MNILGQGLIPPAALPANLLGGPAGAADNFLKLTSLGIAGPGGRMTVLNPAQWGGNYSASGITTIRMDVNNLGTSALHLRLLFENPIAGPPTDDAISADAILLLAGSGWKMIEFPISPAFLTAEFGTVANVLQNTTVLRIFNNPSLASPGPAVAADLGVDNIQAIPETSIGVGSLAALGVLGIVLRRFGR